MYRKWGQNYFYPFLMFQRFIGKDIKNKSEPIFH